MNIGWRRIKLWGLVAIYVVVVTWSLAQNNIGVTLFSGAMIGPSDLGVPAARNPAR
jgi:hypothetical protein